MFIFGGDAHTVTQSSFDSPCIRLDGGFDSGFNGRGADFSRPAPIWTLRITNVSERTPPTRRRFSDLIDIILPQRYGSFVKHPYLRPIASREWSGKRFLSVTRQCTKWHPGL
jgi:hypothetical protein